MISAPRNGAHATAGSSAAVVAASCRSAADDAGRHSSHSASNWAPATVPGRGENILQRCRRVHGPDHAITLWAAAGLTVALAQSGEAEAAHVLAQDILQRARRILGPDHPITLLAAVALTSDQARLGEAEPARVLGEDTLQRCHRTLSPDHPFALYLTQSARSGHPVPSGDGAADRPSRPL